MGIKEGIATQNKLEVLCNQMQRFEVNNARRVWNELTNTISQTISGKNEFSSSEYKDVTDEQYRFVRSVIFEKGDDRRKYVAAHIKDWKDVETQLNLISNDRKVKLIFR